MTAQAGNRDARVRVGGAKPQQLPVPLKLAANVVLYVHAIASVDTAGNVRPGRTSTTDKVVGYNERYVSNAGGLADAKETEGVSRGIIECENSEADPVTVASIGRDVYLVDDQTVAATNGTNTRVRAGTFWGFDEDSGKPLVEVG